MGDTAAPESTSARGLLPPRPRQSDPIAARLRANVRRAITGLDVPPPKIGRFTVERQLGAGAMGVVYEGHDPTLDRRVAIKMIPVAEGETERTLGEARLLARLSHPNVVTVHEAGVLDGSVFIAMEMVSGSTLRQWALGERTPAERLQTLLFAAEGLVAAHQAGITHRDFKPDNVIVSEGGAVRVADFGLARSASSDHSAEDSEGGAARGITSIAGTPAYMAPEQRRNGSFSAASDQYAFCVTACEVLTGSRPGREELASTHRRNMPGLPSKDSVLGGIPHWMRTIVARGLAHDPEARWPSMAALVAMLRDDPATRRRRRLAPAGWLLAVAAAGVAVFVMTRADSATPCDGGRDEIAMTWSQDRAERIADRFTLMGGPDAPGMWNALRSSIDGYAEQWARMQDDSCAATVERGTQSEHRFDLRRACLNDRRHELAALVEGLMDADERATRRAAKAVGALTSVSVCAEVEVMEATVPLPASPEIRARLVEVRAAIARSQAQRKLGDPVASESIAADAVIAARQLAYDPTLAEALSAHAKSLIAQQAEGAEPILWEALDAASRGKHDRAAAAIWLDLLNVVGVQDSRFDEAIGIVASARSTVLRLGKPHDLWGAYLANTASLRLHEGKLAEAAELAEEAVALADEHLQPTDVSSISRFNLLGGVFFRSGNLERARDVLLRALTLAEDNLPPTSGLALTLHTNLASAEYDLGNLESALVHARRAVSIIDQVSWHGPSSSASALAVLGMVEAKLGNHIAALAAGQRILDQVAEDDLAAREIAEQTVGLAYHAAGRYDLAVAHLKRALTLAEKAFGKDHFKVAIHAFNLALAHRERGDRAAAILSFDRARRVQEQVSGPHHATVVSSLIGQGELETELGHIDVGVAHLDRAAALAESPKMEGGESLLLEARSARSEAQAARVR